MKCQSEKCGPDYNEKWKISQFLRFDHLFKIDRILLAYQNVLNDQNLFLLLKNKITKQCFFSYCLFVNKPESLEQARFSTLYLIISKLSMQKIRNMQISLLVYYHATRLKGETGGALISQRFI